MTPEAAHPATAQPESDSQPNHRSRRSEAEPH